MRNQHEDGLHNLVAQRCELVVMSFFFQDPVTRTLYPFPELIPIDGGMVTPGIVVMSGPPTDESVKSEFETASDGGVNHQSAFRRQCIERRLENLLRRTGILEDADEVNQSVFPFPCEVIFDRFLLKDTIGQGLFLFQAGQKMDVVPEYIDSGKMTGGKFPAEGHDVLSFPAARIQNAKRS